MPSQFVQQHILWCGNPAWLIEKYNSPSSSKPFKLIGVAGDPEEIDFLSRTDDNILHGYLPDSTYDPVNMEADGGLSARAELVIL